jgi:23S rRNA (guanosine2251-2'-O)-methyltransferase
VEGRRAVRELLAAGARRVHRIWVAAGTPPAPILREIESLARAARVPFEIVPPGRFAAAARTESPQGVLALAAPVRERDLEELVASEAGPPFLIVDDGITDPYNLGSLLRSAQCAGATGLVLPRHGAARLTPTVTKVAAGAIEHLPLALVPGAAGALQLLRRLGVVTVGLDERASSSLFEVDLGPAVALVLGSEGRGLGRLVRERCDLLVRIPTSASFPSLNVAAAGAVAFFEVARRRKTPSGGTPSGGTLGPRG